MSDETFPSGPWVGFFLDRRRPGRHRMELALEFSNGIMTGEGHDCVGQFIIRGRYDTSSRECHWTKTYIGEHDVYYQGFGRGNGIWGTWEIPTSLRGGFRIWPLAHGAGEDEVETEREELPVEAVEELV